MEYINNKIIAGIILFIILGLLGWFKIKGFSIFDRHKIYKWLKSNTKDEPGESHVDTITIAKGSKLSEDRVRNACMSCNKIYRYSNGKEQWSVWREQPQSCYEGLSKEEIRKRIEF
jgi:uncharacterized protein YneF (UPF0154 family)